MRVQPAQARYTVEESDAFLRITIHARRRIWLAVYIVVVFCAWSTVVAIQLHVLVIEPAPPLFFAYFLSLLLLVGVVSGAHAIAWELAGIESITVTRDALLLSRRIGSFVRTRRYALADTDHFRIPLEHGSWWAEIDAHSRQGPRGIIQFDCHGRRQRFGIGLRVPEAQAILRLFESRVARHSDLGKNPSNL